MLYNMLSYVMFLLCYVYVTLYNMFCFCYVIQHVMFMLYNMLFYVMLYNMLCYVI